MMQSMTGFANAQAEYDGIRISWELRSVNHRFLDLSLRLPEDMKALEAPCREQLAGQAGNLRNALDAAGSALD